MKARKADLERLARNMCHIGKSCGNPNDTKALEEVAGILDTLASEQEPEKPKVESLRDAGRRLYMRGAYTAREDTVDLCALVLRRVQWLAEIMQMQLRGSSGMGDIQAALRQGMRENAQMLGGSE